MSLDPLGRERTLLFERQQALRAKDLVRYAEELTLDVERFRQELKNETHKERVRADFVAGVQNGVHGTPGLFLNGVRYDREWHKESLKSLLMNRADSARNSPATEEKYPQAAGSGVES